MEGPVPAVPVGGITEPSSEPRSPAFPDRVSTRANILDRCMRRDSNHGRRRSRPQSPTRKLVIVVVHLLGAGVEPILEVNTRRNVVTFHHDVANNSGRHPPQHTVLNHRPDIAPSKRSRNTNGPRSDSCECECSVSATPWTRAISERRSDGGSPWSASDEGLAEAVASTVAEVPGDASLELDQAIHGFNDDKGKDPVSHRLFTTLLVQLSVDPPHDDGPAKGVNYCEGSP